VGVENLDGRAQKIRRREKKKRKRKKKKGLLASNQRFSQDMRRLATKKMLRRFKCRIESYRLAFKWRHTDVTLLSSFFKI
jgi:hypothetical protein